MNAPMPQQNALPGAERPFAPSLERRRVRLYLAMVIIDIALMLGAFAVVEFAYLGPLTAPNALDEAQLLLPLYLTLAFYQEAYSIRALEEWRYGARRAILALSVASLLLIFVTFYTKSTATFSRVVFTGGFATTAVLLVLSRRLLSAGIARLLGPTLTNRLLIAAGGPEVDTRHAIRIDAQAHGLFPDPSDPHSFDRLGRYLLNMDRIVVSCPFEDREGWALALRAAGVRGELVTDRLEALAPIGLVVEDGWRSLVVSTGPLGLRQRAMKRAFDLAVTITALVVLSPLLLATAVAIRLEDRGPVLFVQRRMGQGNRLFDMRKFRSMRTESSDHHGGRSASRDDDRVTRVGRLIRRTSIDELPQLINVLRGEMSIVGPRPHALGSQAGDKLFWEVDQAYWRRHSLKPGLTGLAQVRGYRGATDFEADLSNRLEADLEYIRDWRPWSDPLIVLKTLAVLVHPRAY
jgi:lipopolysaccharide/colanic/teichoic acid biosynthesis glycosyltransferase